MLKPFVGLWVLCSIAGCLYPAPIEVEEDAADLPPRILVSNVEPTPGEVVIDLEIISTVPKNFTIRDVEEPNESQTLYWRAVLLYPDSTFATVPTEIPPAPERSFGYSYAPCGTFQEGPATSESIHVLFLAVADSPFLNPGEVFLTNSLEDAIATQTNRPAAVVNWTLKIEGECL